MGLIVRTAGSNKTKNDIENDLIIQLIAGKILKIKQWSQLLLHLIFEESDIIKRSLRDMVNDDVQNIFVEGNDGISKSKNIYQTINAKTNKKGKKI